MPPGRELKMICRAVASGWDLPENGKEACIRRLLKTVVDPKATDRDAARAASVLLGVERLKLEAAKADARSDEPQPVIIVQSRPKTDAFLDLLRDATVEEIPRLRELYKAMLQQNPVPYDPRGDKEPLTHAIEGATPEQAMEFLMMSESIRRRSQPAVSAAI